MKHTLSVLVENKPGVLVRISGLFARRGFNIDSLAVGETEDPMLSRVTISVDGQDRGHNLPASPLWAGRGGAHGQDRHQPGKETHLEPRMSAGGATIGMVQIA